MPSGSQLSGIPARPHKQELRSQAYIRKIPDILQKFTELQKRVNELEAKLQESEKKS